MRISSDLQLKIWDPNIADIKFDLQSRDEIPKVLIGLKHIYENKDLRDKVFSILRKVIPVGINPNTGRPGMDLWKILLLGTLRLICNWDYDKLKEIADQHITLREMLGHAIDDHTKYPLQTIKENVSLLTPQVLDEINQVVVKAGHTIAGKKEGEALKAKCDSFVLESNVAHPTDIYLLFTAVRKMIVLIAVLCSEFGLSAWRQSHKNYLTVKRLFNHLRKLNHSTSRNEKVKEEKKEEIAAAYQSFIDVASIFINKAKSTIAALRAMGCVDEGRIEAIEKFIKYAEIEIDQIRRRVLGGETIPHGEKIFSLFEPQAEWISKGKAGVPQELGVRVCILEDQYGFILHHQVMWKKTDDKVTVPMVQEAKERFSDLRSCSFDKGFYTPQNRKDLMEILDLTVLPKKGRLSSEDVQIESSEEFLKERQKHPAVESAINALENHGLDRCPDHGIAGFERYVALAVLARNIQILGHLIQRKERKRMKRREKYRKTWQKNRLAA